MHLISAEQLTTGTEHSLFKNKKTGGSLEGGNGLRLMKRLGKTK